MTRMRWDIVLQQVRSLVAQPLASLGDAELLSRFVGSYDEAAFEVLLGRHGPMVLRVAHRILRSEPDAEDVFQATFLLLTRRSASIRKRESLASWLHGVAHRLALRARSERGRRQAREMQATSGQEAETPPQSAWTDLEAMLDEVLAQLPPRYRAPLVYCYLEGRTQEEVADLLGVPSGTVRSWLARGRELLRQRLVRRGVSLSVSGLNTALLATAANAAATGVPSCLRTSTLKYMPRIVARGPLDVVSPAVSALLREGMTSMFLSRLKTGTTCLLLLDLLTSGTGLFAPSGLESRFQGPNAEAFAMAERGAEELKGAARDAKRVDLQGDQLPPGALVRLGTTSFRHEDRVESVALTPDGRTLASVAGNSLMLWGPATGQLVHRYTIDTALHCLAFAPDGNSVVVGGEDCSVRLLDLKSGNELRRFLGHQRGEMSIRAGVWGAAFVGDGRSLLTWGSDSTVRRWDLAAGTERRLEGADWSIRSLFRLGTDGRYLAVPINGSEKVLWLWDIAAGKEVQQLTHPGTVGRVAFAPDGKALAVSVGTSEQPGQISIWEIPGGREIGTLPANGESNFALAFSPDGKALVSAGSGRSGGKVRLWDVATQQELRKPQNLPSSISQMVFSPDGKTLFLRGSENRIHLWDVPGWQEKILSDGPNQALTVLTYSPDGKWVASACNSGIWLWDSATGKVLRKLDRVGYGELAVLFSADGKSLVSACRDGTLCICDLETGKEQRRLQGRVDQRLDQLALSPDGTTVASWGFRTDSMILLRHAGTGKELRTLEVPPEKQGVRSMFYSLCFSHDGKSLYGASGTHLAVLRWDVPTGKLLPSIGKHNGGLNGIALAPDGRSLAVVTMGGSLYLWELATGQARLIVMDAGYATSVAFSPDGRLLALANSGRHRVLAQTRLIHSGLDDRDQVRLVRVADGKVVRRLTGHVGGIASHCFSSDGRTLASGGQDTTGIIWEVPDRTVTDLQEDQPLKPDELAAVWTSLGGEAAEAHSHMARLLAVPAQAIVLFRDRLQPVIAADPARIASLLKKFESDRFDDRETASRELKELGDSAEPWLRKALKENLSAESRRRLEADLDQLGGSNISGKRLQVLRAIEVLERIADQDARDLLKRLAAGAPGAWLTEESRGTLQRQEQKTNR